MYSLRQMHRGHGKRLEVILVFQMAPIPVVTPVSLMSLVQPIGGVFMSLTPVAINGATKPITSQLTHQESGGTPVGPIVKKYSLIIPLLMNL